MWFWGVSLWACGFSCALNLSLENKCCKAELTWQVKFETLYLLKKPFQSQNSHSISNPCFFNETNGVFLWYLSDNEHTQLLPHLPVEFLGVISECLCPTPTPAVQEHEGRRHGQGSVCGERAAAEGAGGDGAAAENRGEEKLFTGRENCQPQQNSEELGLSLLQPSSRDQVLAKLVCVTAPCTLLKWEYFSFSLRCLFLLNEF